MTLQELRSSNYPPKRITPQDLTITLQDRAPKNRGSSKDLSQYTAEAAWPTLYLQGVVGTTPIALIVKPSV